MRSEAVVGCGLHGRALGGEGESGSGRHYMPGIELSHRPTGESTQYSRQLGVVASPQGPPLTFCSKIPLRVDRRETSCFCSKYLGVTARWRCHLSRN